MKQNGKKLENDIVTVGDFHCVKQAHPDSEPLFNKSVYYLASPCIMIR